MDSGNNETIKEESSEDKKFINDVSSGDNVKNIEPINNGFKYYVLLSILIVICVCIIIFLITKLS